MKRLIQITFSMAALMAAVLFMGMKDVGHNTLAIHFKHYMGKKELQLDNQLYLSEKGQSYTITKFKYYVGHLRLTAKNGKDVLLPDYYLINEDEPESKDIVWKEIPDGEYTALHFIVGVDSVHNCSGAQSGALDPVNAMFWAWNTGYIFLKLEGKSVASNSPGNIFEYHIGGYKGEYNCIRDVKIDFAQPLKMVSGKSSQLVVKTEVSTIIDGCTLIDFAKLSSVTDFHNSTIIADNYAGMFSILNIKQ